MSNRPGQHKAPLHQRLADALRANLRRRKIQQLAQKKKFSAPVSAASDATEPGENRISARDFCVGDEQLKQV